MAFYIGFQYMNGAYKITEGYFIEMESTLKDLSLLFVFGIVELMFQLFKRMSHFDQTDNFKYVYSFDDQYVAEKQKAIEAQMANMKQMALREELQDLIDARIRKPSTMPPVPSAMKIQG